MKYDKLRSQTLRLVDPTQTTRYGDYVIHDVNNFDGLLKVKNRWGSFVWLSVKRFNTRGLV